MFFAKLKKITICSLLSLTLNSFASDKEIVVASKIDTEGSVLGNILKYTLMENGFSVVDKLQLGNTQVVRQALINRQIDIYPEYVGNGAFFFNMEADDVWKDAEKSFKVVQEKDLAENKLIWLNPPAPANNTWGVAITNALAQEHNIVTFEDFADFVNEGGNVKLAASAEFVNSPVALPEFQNTYGFQLNSKQLLILSSGNTAATIKAAATQQDGVNAAMIYSTDGALAELDLTVLQDNLNSQAFYQPALVATSEIIEKHPEIQQIMASVFMNLTTEKLRDLNAKVVIAGINAADVAKEFLQAEGIIQ